MAHFLKKWAITSRLSFQKRLITVIKCSVKIADDFIRPRVISSSIRSNVSAVALFC